MLSLPSPPLHGTPLHGKTGFMSFMIHGMNGEPVGGLVARHRLRNAPKRSEFQSVVSHQSVRHPGALPPPLGKTHKDGKGGAYPPPWARGTGGG